ncbi:MAG: 6-phosphogluconolactonase [Candidatus Pacebacteria bacterium]|nr:6-phosphogluconolactonase [Candidatus Paceibacterota bacterium]MCF7863065.1 6-phosphogluconolactonase [Candidatus Paceibacterota bacterium]
MEEAVSYISSLILEKLADEKKVLLLLSGGSSVSVNLQIIKILKNHNLDNLYVSLVDERYGAVGHIDSNWTLMQKEGLDTLQAKMYPVLLGENIVDTTKNFEGNLKWLLGATDYKIGIFGIGGDGHTAGILPKSEAVKAESLAFQYSTEKYNRITITPKCIRMLDEAVLVAKEGEKDDIILQLENEDKDFFLMPAQTLKKVPILKIFKF